MFMIPKLFVYQCVQCKDLRRECSITYTSIIIKRKKFDGINCRTDTSIIKLQFFYNTETLSFCVVKNYIKDLHQSIKPMKDCNKTNRN